MTKLTSKQKAEALAEIDRLVDGILPGIRRLEVSGNVDCPNQA